MKLVQFTGVEIGDYVIFGDAVLDDDYRFIKWVNLDMANSDGYLDPEQFPEEVVKQAEEDVVLFAQDEAGEGCVEDVSEDELDEFETTGVLIRRN